MDTPMSWLVKKLRAEGNAIRTIKKYKEFVEIYGEDADIGEVMRNGDITYEEAMEIGIGKLALKEDDEGLLR